MSCLITADIHMTTLPRDEYRWGLLPWLAKTAQDHKVHSVLILGDLVVEKDNHPSVLVNRLVNGICDIAQVADVYILKGNHDYLDADHPFFAFLRVARNVEYIAKPRQMTLTFPGYTGTPEQIRREKAQGKISLTSTPVIFLPATPRPLEDWRGIDFSHFDYAFAHATFDGAVAENGVKLDGIPTSIFKNTSIKVISGDIHVPQKLTNKIEYVGAPYRVHFGDTYEPRVMLLGNDGTTKNLHFSCPNKHLLTVRSLRDLENQGKIVFPLDQVKVRVKLRRSEYVDWPSLRNDIAEYAKDHDWNLFQVSLSPIEEKEKKVNTSLTQRQSAPEKVKEYVKRKDLSPRMEKLGLSFLEG